ncbi:hypothetical protein BM1_04626 [Bipolaris maydis]|nr:hypothetical protein BM1_04626 [Bipolaris maydis]
MAPSRALLLRRITFGNATPHLPLTSRLITTFATPLKRTPRSSALWSSPVRQPQICICKRAYSQSASTTLQAPDYLNEAESHVFNKLKSELEPVKLEISHNVEMPASRADDTGRATDRCIENMRVISASQRLSEGVVGQTFGYCWLAYGCCRHAEPNQAVQDISGGCGSMYAIEIESPKFKGLTVIKQHKMVNEVLKDEIQSWHGVQLRTKAA